jgi:hypothetical protein
MNFGLLYADRFEKSKRDFHYWQILPQAAFMMGFPGIEKAVYLEDSERMLMQRTVLQEGWLR